MRVKLHLKAFRTELITINYNYALNAAVYKILKLGSQEFAEFLHNKGYKTNGRNYKLFTFALQFEKLKLENDSIRLLSPNAYLYISSPLDNDFVKNFIIGTFKSEIINIIDDGYSSKFEPYQIEAVPEPDFQEINNFSMLSPLILSIKKTTNGKTQQHYLRYEDSIEKINEILNNNLKRKYNLIFGEQYNGEQCELVWDEKYYNKVKDKKRLSKLVRIKAVNNDEVYYRSILSPFKLKGNPKLIKVGYQCGFGEKNSMGFGMVKLLT